MERLSALVTNSLPRSDVDILPPTVFILEAVRLDIAGEFGLMCGFSASDWTHRLRRSIHQK